MIKIRDLQYLTAIDEHRHFGRAAQACFVSQPTLSGQIIKLEEQLGLTLVERHRKKVMLTPEGEQLVQQAKAVLQAADQFELTAKALLDPLAGNLHIGLIPTLAPYLLPHIMQDLTQALPQINCYLHENKTHHLLQALDKGHLDLLILPWLQDMSAFEHYHLFDEKLLLALPAQHALNKKKKLKLSDLKDQTVFTLEDGHCLRDQALGYCFAAGAREDSRFQATSLETLRYMVASGLGITLIPELAAMFAGNTSMINYLPFAKPEPAREIVLLVRPNYPRMQCIRTVVASIRDSVKNLNH